MASRESAIKLDFPTTPELLRAASYAQGILAIPDFDKAMVFYFDFESAVRASGTEKSEIIQQEIAAAIARGSNYTREEIADFIGAVIDHMLRM